MEKSSVQEVRGLNWLLDSRSVASSALTLLEGHGPATPEGLIAAVAAEQIALFDGTVLAWRNLKRAQARLSHFVKPGDPVARLLDSFEPLASALEEGTPVGEAAMFACKSGRFRALQLIAKAEGAGDRTPVKAELLRIATLSWSLEARGYLGQNNPGLARETLRNALAEAQDVAFRLYGRMGEFLGTALGVYLWEQLVAGSPLEGGQPLTTPEREALLDLALQFRYPLAADGARVAWVAERLQCNPEHETLRGHRLRVCKGPQSEEVPVGGPLDVNARYVIRWGAWRSVSLLAECIAGQRALMLELYEIEKSCR